MTDPDSLLAGTRLGALEIVRVLGRGASGAVFEVRHVELGRRSALKVVAAAAFDDDARTRFAREVQALARIKSPHVVRIHGLVDVPGGLAYEMELVAGESLDKRLARGPLPWRDAVALVAKLARALEEVHAAGIVHRDVKPGNVLLGAEGRVVLADFGLARALDAASLTRTGAIVGTPLSMSPEALSGSEATTRSDVYGLGVVLYEALEGRPPFDAESFAMLLHKVTRGECAKTAAAGAPPELESIRARAMAPEPSKRTSSARALAEQLERLLERSAAPRPAPAIRGLALVALVVFATIAALVAARGPSSERVVGPVVKPPEAVLATSVPVSDEEARERAGILAAESGLLSRRAEAVAALVTGKPRSTTGRALGRALALADALAAHLRADEDAAPSARRLTTECEAFLRDPRLAAAIPVVLDPVTSALIELWRSLRVGFATHGDDLRTILELLAAVDANASPRALALRIVLLHAYTGPDEATLARGLTIPRLAAAARALTAEEPLLAATALDAALRRDESTEAPTSEQLQARLDALDAADGALGAAVRRGLATEAETVTATLARRRLAQSRGFAEEAFASSEAPGSAARREHLERALVARRRELEAARGSELLARNREDAARAVLWCEFELDRTDEWTDPARELTNPAVRDALAAEVLRRKGDARAARELAARAVAADRAGAPDPVAALALAEADAGALDAARGRIERLGELEHKGPPVIRGFRVSEVSRRLREK